MHARVKRYLIDAMSGMAQGLFATLLVGTIIKTLGQQLARIGFDPAQLLNRVVDENGVETVVNTAATFGQIIKMGIFHLADFFVTAGGFAMKGEVVGAAMAVGIGFAMKLDPLVLFSLTAVGAFANVTGGAGGPLAVLLIAIVAGELGGLVSKKTKVDILVTPLTVVLAGGLLTVLFAKWIGVGASKFGNLIMWATELQPFWMGILVSLLVGVALTLPISSAAICAALGLVGLAGGAAVAGCCAQMVGFAVLSFKENRAGGLLSQGLGTSMLQMPNIIKNPKVWIAPCVASMITGPIATCVFKMEMNGAAISSGMGTCGLVGPIGVITGWLAPSKEAIEHEAQAITPGFFQWFGLLMVCIVLPAVLCWGFGILFRKIGWIKDGDLSLQAPVVTKKAVKTESADKAE